MTAAAATHGLTAAQKSAFDRDGFVILPRVFTLAECQAVIDHMLDLAQGRKKIEGFPKLDLTQKNWGRTHNQHVYDPLAMDLLLHPRLRQPLADAAGGEVDGIQTMYFWQGSEQRRHQDQHYLPACLSAWIALVDVGPHNGSICVQPGSHKGRLLTQADFKDAEGKPLPFGDHYNDAVDQLFTANSLPETQVEAKAGDVVIFHGVLIHRGGPVGELGSPRHVMANHYIPTAFDGWPYAGWARHTFDRVTRMTDPATRTTRVV